MAEKTPAITPIDGERGPADRYTLPAQGEAEDAETAAEEKAQPKRKQAAAQDKES